MDDYNGTKGIAAPHLDPVHLHGVHDTSIYLYLPKARGAELTELGWAEPHQDEDFGMDFLLFGLGTETESNIAFSVIGESIAFARSPARRGWRVC